MSILFVSFKGGKQIRWSLILYSIRAGTHLPLAAQISFLYFVAPYSIAHGTLIHMNMKILQLVCYFFSYLSSCNFTHDFSDFASCVYADASFLDEWSLEQFQSLLNRSNEDEKLKELLQQDNLVVFLHLLGCDSNGHAHRPYSPIYLNNVKVVDHIAERVYNLVQNYFKDNLTSYVFTADHGMSDKG